MTSKLLTFGAMVAACAFLNLFVGVTVIGLIDERNHIMVGKLAALETIKTDDDKHGVRVRRRVVGGKPAVKADTPGESEQESPLQTGNRALGAEGSLESKRFPVYGTELFAHQCSWTERNQTDLSSRNCTILATPLPPYTEGISKWISTIATGYILSQQTGCKLILNYGKGVNVDNVMSPISQTNWMVPSGFNCHTDPQCFIAQPNYTSGTKATKEIESVLDIHNLSSTPNYRFAYRSAYSKSPFLYENEFLDLQRALPGFSVETGMACSLGRLFQLAPNASQFEPELFSRILPTLHSNDALVMSLYIRTHQTDVSATAEENGTGTTTENAKEHLKMATGVVDCALNVEKDHLAEWPYSRVIWMVLTDSQYVKKWVTDNYDSRFMNRTNSFERTVLTTRSRGAHTRTKRRPSTSDFAEALIDWYLIGESDLVILDGRSPSFGDSRSSYSQTSLRGTHV